MHIGHKSLLVFLAALLCCLSIYSQSQTNMTLKDGRTWHLVTIHKDLFANSIDSSFYSVIVDGDTLIAGNSYKVIRYLVSDNTSKKNGIYALAYEEDRKVFEYWNNKLSEYSSPSQVLLDFGIGINDKWIACRFEQSEDVYYEEYPVREIDSIFVKGKMYTRYRLGISHYQGDIVAVEGIGLNDNSYAYYNLIWPAMPDGQIYWDEIISVYDGETCVFEASDFYALSTSSITLKFSDSSFTGTYYDLQGRQVQVPSGRGLYIKDGKKVLVTE